MAGAECFLRRDGGGALRRVALENSFSSMQGEIAPRKQRVSRSLATTRRRPLSAMQMKSMGLATVPFSHETELCSELQLQEVEGQKQITSTSKLLRLPGHPRISLAELDVRDVLEREMMTPDLNRMAPHLWLVAKPSSDHCNPLHEQVVRGRNIVITENPELHLCWIDSKVFIKPIPRCLLSWAFWRHYLDDSNANSDPKAKAKLIEAVLGYMRSYNFLVRHESDYRIAVKEHLIPVTATYEDFMIFISSFAEIQDSQVSPRYRFGELRLRRLNLWSPLLLKKTYFHKIVWQYGDYLAQYYAPYLFFFGIFSVVLSAMQVGVGAKKDWQSFYGVSAWFSVATLIVNQHSTSVELVEKVSESIANLLYSFIQRAARQPLLLGAKVAITTSLASFSGALDTDITSRAAVIHDNAAALASQEAELRKRTGALAGENARAEQAGGCAELDGGVGVGFVGAGGDGAAGGRGLDGGNAGKFNIEDQRY
ncbi:uncharacterized protein BDR25DRAFT_314467 [Lindgomyces ingoldianus]|uniref:Uncharacterized protein n=1 Tax=Lindgomyces ingoldianus TaxID=673940 RepID=A0ACB6QX65_9PLEO|nr:uncharacterized protein BDR25DRAFT_314467 [Lindgomyces ingoldianus]KAF2470796.1 hypothetical protein BDR25DRAFT_314467 [Lindgomyces ingoldianus]